MIGLPSTLRTAVMSMATVALLLNACARPEGFHIDTDAGVVLPNLGTGGIAQVGSTGGMVGSGGVVATGGVVGVGGSASSGGSSGGAGGSGGIAATGGEAPGGRGEAAGGGSGTASGGAASGGMGGSGGGAGMGGAGVLASGGAGGRLGTGGGTAGSSGGGGTGAAGSAGSGGVVGTNPCAGLCTKPIVFTTKMFSSGNLGTAATCHETSASITSGNCTNFTTRTFKVNNTTMPTTGDNWPTLPAKRNGGYCFQASVGTPDFAAFVTF